MMNRKLAKRILRRGESGIALISVLLLIATGSLLAMMVMSISKTTSFTVMPFIQLQRSYYAPRKCGKVFPLFFLRPQPSKQA